MDAKEQGDGKRRVKVHLIDPLKRLGLVRPSTLTVVQFEEMIDDLAARLSYMSALNLSALAEQVAARPGGKDGSRFPIAAKILSWAADIQSPPDSASPLMKAVFADRLGQTALAEDWAPELLSFVRRNRSWPLPPDLRAIHDRANTARQRLEKQNDNLARGLALSDEDALFRRSRAAAADKCRRIALSVSEGVG